MNIDDFKFDYGVDDYKSNDQDVPSPSVMQIIQHQIISSFKLTLVRQMIKQWMDLRITIEKPELKKMYKRHHKVLLSHGWTIFYGIFSLFMIFGVIFI